MAGAGRGLATGEYFAGPVLAVMLASGSLLEARARRGHGGSWVCW